MFAQAAVLALMEKHGELVASNQAEEAEKLMVQIEDIERRVRELSDLIRRRQHLERGAYSKAQTCRQPNGPRPFSLLVGGAARRLARWTAVSGGRFWPH